MYFIAVEITKLHQNIGTYIRLTAAFGATALIVVGYENFGSHGAHGAQKYVPLIHFYRWEDCVLFAKNMNCSIYGISSGSVDNSVDIESYRVNFSTNCIFVISVNSDCSLSQNQISMCDKVLFPKVMVANCLKYEAVIGIILNKYCSSLNLQQRSFTEEKFDIESSMRSGCALPSYITDIVETLNNKYIQSCGNESDNVHESLGNLFGDDECDL